MSEGENKPLIHAGTIPKKEYVITADRKITISQIKNEHRIEMEKLPPDDRCLNPMLVKEDENSTIMLRDEYQSQFYFGTSTGDGNCLYHACSLAICGDESLSAKLRQDTADELLKNPGEYCTNHPYIDRFVKEKNLDNDAILAIKQDRGLNPLLVKKDKKATKMLPDQSQFYCGTSTGDGNCLYHACSLAICGDESLSAQLRQDTAAELLKNPGDYCTNHPYIDRFVQEKNLDNDAKLAIPIQSICPEVPRTFRELYNGTIQPLPRKPKEPKEITLFWTGVSRVGATLVPSHIVPVLSKQDNMNTDSTIFKGCLTCQKKIPVYETKCLTKGCSNHVDPGYLKIEQGDHIEVPAEGCCGLFINHHAIVDSFECSNNGNGKIQVWIVDW
ncbi:hypothetical protein DPMN_165236 [Dreissena polymorpha]|uniref:Uncharacterized protein n=1 Tax=Dreissena polymorpha TaxID=45954 RepID=A0A9D4IUF0_DREPO|nr:hypothetical protein DPMN_165236 [Dreissena polymorpha]